MDEQQLQLKEQELKLQEANLTFREIRLNQDQELTINKQEYLRRAIEVGSNALSKLFPFNKEIENKDLVKELTGLVLVSVEKLKEEVSK